MNDKVKEFRDENPILDFLAGFIPGVGEALDAHDFIHAAKDKDYTGMGLAAIGLMLPGFTGGLIKKGIKVAKKLVDKPNLSQALIEKGWKEIDGKIFSPSGEEFVRHSDGRLLSKRSAEQADKVAKQLQNIKKRLIEQLKMYDTFDKQAEEFRLRSRLDFGLDNWRSLAKGHQQTAEETEKYIKEAFPNFVKTYDELIKSGKLRFNPTTKKYEAYFENLVFDRGRLALRYGKGFRELSDLDTMQYIIVNSPQGKNKFMWQGITMYLGIPSKRMRSFELGENKQSYEKWFDSDRKGASYYSKSNGMLIFGLPIKPSIINSNWDNKPRIIRQQVPNPTSNNWNGMGQSPISSFLSKDRTKTMNISEGPLVDDAASRFVGTNVKGIFSVVGNDIPVKSAFGGSGMYDTKGENLYKPFASYAVPIGISSMIGFKALNNERD